MFFSGFVLCVDCWLGVCLYLGDALIVITVVG